MAKQIDEADCMKLQSKCRDTMWSAIRARIPWSHFWTIVGSVFGIIFALLAIVYAKTESASDVVQDNKNRLTACETTMKSIKENQDDMKSVQRNMDAKLDSILKGVNEVKAANK